jgi:hypothetical protein
MLANLPPVHSSLVHSTCNGKRYGRRLCQLGDGKQNSATCAVSPACCHGRVPKHAVEMNMEMELQSKQHVGGARQTLQLFRSHPFNSRLCQYGCARFEPHSSCRLQVLVYNQDGTCVKKFQGEGKGLGVRSIGWSACGQYLAIGSYGPVCMYPFRLLSSWFCPAVAV